ncbi:MAG: type II toxin-antitoxin system RelE/ParE family toxin [Magnetococcales bacterium]|nr:type II toxin-antitoxin system RelE/ParE family toxin [Magnetococcales bacterium]
MQKAISNLRNLPKSHPVAPESKAFDCEIRHLFVGRRIPWRVFFTIDGETVQVLHVRHGRQDYWKR